MKKLTNPTQEQWFDIWAEEVEAAGYIDEVVREPDVPTFELFEGYSKPFGKKKNVIMRPVVYTPDRIIKWNDKAIDIFIAPFYWPAIDMETCYFNPQLEGKNMFHFSILDIKGPTGSQKAYGSDFKFTQKWLWAKTQQYVQKVMLSPVKPLKKDVQYLWAATFTPQRYLWTDKLTKLRTIPNKKGVPNWEVRTLKEFIKLRSSTA